MSHNDKVKANVEIHVPIDEILAALPQRYRDLVDKGTANGLDLDKAIIASLSVMAIQHPNIFKNIQKKLERKHK